jgi:uroporphyrin-III C-methyltransferase/precorrin-2 dehydrogenase/sirohydrochlorin ferrochelatase
MPQRVENAEIQPPTLIIVGTVVLLHEKLNWFQTQ